MRIQQDQYCYHSSPCGLTPTGTAPAIINQPYFSSLLQPKRVSKAHALKDSKVGGSVADAGKEFQMGIIHRKKNLP